MNLRPVSLKQANEYVAAHHRHSKPTVGHKFSIGVEKGGELVGVAIVGRPVARTLDDGYTAEILRVCTTGTRNACSMLYGASKRAARGMGYTRVITYTMTVEDGASLKASGFKPVAESAAQHWNRPSRPRDSEHHTISARVRWEAL